MPRTRAGEYCKASDFMPGLAYTREHNPVATNPEVPQMFKLAPGNDVEAAPQLSEMLQERKVPVRLHGKTYRARNPVKAAVELAVSIRNRRAAVEVSRRAKLPSGRD